jgi:hypothetical protein
LSLFFDIVRKHAEQKQKNLWHASATTSTGLWQQPAVATIATAGWTMPLLRSNRHCRLDRPAVTAKG